MFLSLLAANGWAQDSEPQSDQAIAVEGTELALHQSAMDVLRVLPFG